MCFLVPQKEFISLKTVIIFMIYNWVLNFFDIKL